MKNNLSKVLGEKRISMAELAKGSCVSIPAIRGLYYEKTKRIDMAIVEKICNYLGLNVSDFFKFEKCEKEN